LVGPGFESCIQIREELEPLGEDQFFTTTYQSQRDAGSSGWQDRPACQRIRRGGLRNGSESKRGGVRIVEILVPKGHQQGTDLIETLDFDHGDEVGVLGTQAGGGCEGQGSQQGAGHQANSGSRKGRQHFWFSDSRRPIPVTISA